MGSRTLRIIGTIPIINDEKDNQDEHRPELPTEVWVQIFKQLSLNDVLSFSMSCSKFKKIIETYILIPQFGQNFIQSIEELNWENIDAATGLSKIIEQVGNDEKWREMQEFIISKGCLELTNSSKTPEGVVADIIFFKGISQSAVKIYVELLSHERQKRLLNNGMRRQWYFGYYQYIGEYCANICLNGILAHPREEKISSILFLNIGCS